jgi:hypothetical protein
MPEGDQAFPVQTLCLWIELARAEAGLGEHLRAGERLDGLIARHAPGQGALTLGLLHEARVEVALAAEDVARARLHVAEMERWLRPTGIPALIEQCDLRSRALSHKKSDERPSLVGTLATACDAGALEAVFKESVPVAQRMTRALEQLVSSASAQEAHLYLLAGTGVRHFSSFGAAAPSELVSRWVEERVGLATELHSQLVTGTASTTASDETRTRLGSDVRAFDARSHRLALLYEEGPRRDQVAGVLVFAADDPFELPPRKLLDVLEQQLPVLASS